MKVVRQDGNMDCGVACLLSVIRFYHGNVPIEYLREKTKTNKSGVNAYKLVETAKEIGFTSYGLNGNINDVKDDMLPIISHVVINKSLKHFIVIYNIDRIKKRILIMDPSKGKRVISFSEFNLMTSNNYIYLKPEKNLPNILIKHFVYKWLKYFSGNHKTYIFYIISFSLLVFILNIICSFHFSFILNNSINYNVYENLVSISTVLLVIYLLKETTDFCRNKTSIKFSFLLDEYITKHFYNKLILLPFMYYRNRTTGEVVARMNDLSIIKQFLTRLLSTIFTDLLVVLVFIIILFKKNRKVFILILIVCFINFLIQFISNNSLKKKLDKYHEKEDKINSIFIENLNSIITIKNLHLEYKTINKFYNEYQKLISSSYSVSNNLLYRDTMSNIIKDFFYVLFYYFLAICVINKEISISSIIILQNIISYFLSSFNNILSLNNEYIKYKISKKRIDDLFMIRGDNFCCRSYFLDNKFNGVIKYHNLTYSYNSKKLFDNLSLTIKKKDKVFLYGDSGCGKSTLMKILLRYIEVPFGTVSINNIDINHVHLGLIRDRILYISQSESLFRGSIKDNISLDKEINDEVLNKIVDITCLDEVVKNKELKLDTLIDNEGYNVSGGERQRIVLARSLLKDSDIYIFDEAFSQIDEEKEKIILKNIFKYLEDKTIIVISHRMSNLDLFNRIIRLEEGKVYEEISR